MEVTAIEAKGLFSDVLERMKSKTASLKESDFNFDDRYLFGTKYGVLNTLLEEKRSVIESIVGEPLYPTYSMVFMVRKGGLFLPKPGPYTQDVSVLVPIKLHKNTKNIVTYLDMETEEFVDTKVAEGDASIIDGFKVNRGLYPVSGGPKTNINIFAKFNYIRQSDPCSELLRLDGYPDLYGEGPTPDRVTRTSPDWMDRVNRQFRKNYPEFASPNYERIDELFQERSVKEYGAKFSGVTEGLETQGDREPFA